MIREDDKLTNLLSITDIGDAGTFTKIAYIRKVVSAKTEILTNFIRVTLADADGFSVIGRIFPSGDPAEIFSRISCYTGKVCMLSFDISSFDGTKSLYITDISLVKEEFQAELRQYFFKKIPHLSEKLMKLSEQLTAFTLKTSDTQLISMCSKVTTEYLPILTNSCSEEYGNLVGCDLEKVDMLQLLLIKGMDLFDITLSDAILAILAYVVSLAIKLEMELEINGRDNKEVTYICKIAKFADCFRYASENTGKSSRANEIEYIALKIMGISGNQSKISNITYELANTIDKLSMLSSRLRTLPSGGVAEIGGIQFRK